MICNQGNLQSEIMQLLEKIDVLNVLNSDLKNELDDVKRINMRLEEELKAFKINQMKASKQRTRILRERDEIVRDISCELDTVSAKLNSELKEKSLFEVKFKDKQAEMEVVEAQLNEVKLELQAQNKIILKQREELHQLQQINKKNEEIKIDIKNDNLQEKIKSKQINNKMEQNTKKNKKFEMNKNEQEIKSQLKNSNLIDISINNNNCSCQKEEIHIKKSRIQLYKNENNFLKKKVIKLLNQYFLSHDNQKSNDFFSSSFNNNNKFEINLNKKIDLPNQNNFINKKNNQKQTEHKISSIINASFVEQSNIIGGKTFHFIGKKTSSYPEFQDKLFSGKFFF